MKYFVIALALLLIGGGIYYFVGSNMSVENPDPTLEEQNENTSTTTLPGEVTTPTPEADERGSETIIGSSVKGNDIIAYHYGSGEDELLFIGGVHGGYSWNTSLVAFELMDYLDENSGMIPENVTVTVIPVLNPDGLEAVVGTPGRFDAPDVDATESERIAARFNANDVDLNRNFDCKWQPESTWQTRTVSGGDAAFSEPESQAIRSYVEDYKPTAVVTWYSAAGGVYSSNCERGVPRETTTITNLYANASGYQAYEEFDYYEITGDMVNWFASEGIPAISVLLTDHQNTEWSKNRAGIEALFDHYKN